MVVLNYEAESDNEKNVKEIPTEEIDIEED